MRIKKLKTIVPDCHTILDIGTNAGKEIKKFLVAFPNAKIFAFEAEKTAFRSLSKNFCRENRVICINCAVSEKTGTTDFYVSYTEERNKVFGSKSSSSILPPNKILEYAPKIKFRDKISIPSVSIDDWISDKNIFRVDFIWADVQGAEANIIEGAKETLKKTRFFYTEFGNVEYYKGQSVLDDMLKMLPYFKVEEISNSKDNLCGNILLKNINF